MQAVWQILLDDKFTDAYENGIIITFPDGIQWWQLFLGFFPTQLTTLKSKPLIFYLIAPINFAEYFYAVSNT